MTSPQRSSGLLHVASQKHSESDAVVTLQNSPKSGLTLQFSFPASLQLRTVSIYATLCCYHCATVAQLDLRKQLISCMSLQQFPSL